MKSFLVVIGFLVVGCGQIASMGRVALDLCEPACSEVQTMGADKCQSVCVTVLEDERIPVEMTFVCSEVCEQAVALGKTKCVDVCQDGVTAVVEKIEARR